MTRQTKHFVRSLLRSLPGKVAGLLLVCTLPLLGQYTTATLVGTVHDPSGAVVPGAMVTALNVATNFAQTFTTSDTGEFLFPRLPVGSYNLEVEKPGFGGYLQSGIVLTVNDTTTQDVTLTVGATAQQVRVSANATWLQPAPRH
jgi:hypothetical protein